MMKSRMIWLVVVVLLSGLIVQSIFAQSCEPGMVFVSDVTVPDDTGYPPGASFEKVWRLRNSGTCDWNENYSLSFIGGEALGQSTSQPLGKTVAVGETSDIGIMMQAPDNPGNYTSWWQLHDDSGNPFGNKFYVRINVLGGEGTALAFVETPLQDTTINGQIDIRGSAVHPQMDYFKLEFGPGENPSDDQMTPIGELRREQIPSGLLGTWDTTGVEDGLYSLRLRVVDVTGNYQEAWVRRLTVNNTAPPKPSPAATKPVATETSTPTPTPTPMPTQTSAPAEESTDEFVTDVVAMMTAVAGGAEAQPLLDALAGKHFLGAGVLSEAETPAVAVATKQPVEETPVEPQIDLQVTSYMSYTDAYDYMYVVGEVVNKGNVPVKDVEISLVLSDEEDQELGIENYNRCSLFVLPVGGSYPFSFSIDEEQQGWASLEVQVEASEYEAGESYYTLHPALAIGNVMGHDAADEYDNYTLTGKIVNSGDVPARNIKLVGVAYDEAGQVVDAGNTYPNLSVVPAGGSVPFELRFDGLKEKPARHELIVQGWEDTEVATKQAEVPFEVVSYNSYVDGWERLHVVGEAINKGSVPARNVKIVAAMLDEQGDVLAISSSNWEALELVPAEGKYPFGFRFGEEAADFQSVEIQLQAQPHDEENSPMGSHSDLKAESVEGIEPETDWNGYKLAGEVVNNGTVPAKWVKVVAVAYDGTGAVVDVGNTSPELEGDVLEPGAGAVFELELRGLKEAPAHYEIFIQGRVAEIEEGASPTATASPTPAPSPTPTSTPTPLLEPTSKPLPAGTPADSGWGFTGSEGEEKLEPTATLLPTETPAPTDTPVPTSTPLPAATPTVVSSGFGFTAEGVREAKTPAVAMATEQPVGPQIDLQVTNYMSYTDSYDYMYVVGEVVNEGNVPVKDVQISLVLFDEEGNELGVEEYNRSSLFVLPVGEPYPFSFSIDEELKNWARLEVEVEANEYEAGKTFYTLHPALAVANMTGRDALDEYDDYTVTGKIVNDSDVPARNIRLVGVAYDENGQVVDAVSSYPHLSIVLAGDSVPFEMRFDGLKKEPARYELMVQGWEDTDEAAKQAEVPFEVTSYSSYVDGWERLHVVGEAINNGAVPARNVKIVAALLDEQSNVLAISSSNWEALELIPDGGKYPFGFQFGEEIGDWQEIEIQLQAQPYDEEKSPVDSHSGLKVESVEGIEPESDWSGYKLAGEVVNGGAMPAKWIKVVAVAYDETGKVIDVGNASPKLEEDTLEPGTSAPFELEFRGLKKAPGDYEIFIQGRIAEDS